MFKFYKWLYKLSRKKLRQIHSDKYKVDIRCPTCKRWFSESSLFHKHKHVSEPDWGFHIRCGACEHESYWNAEIAPVLIACDKSGVPLK